MGNQPRSPKAACEEGSAHAPEAAGLQEGILSSLQLTAIVSITIAGLLAAYLAKVPLAAGFTAGLAALSWNAMRRGIPAAALLRSAWSGIGHTKEVMWILLLVGMLIPAWMAGGTIAYLIDTGLRLMHPGTFVTGSFLLCAVISMVLGTSTGTLSSAGIPLMGVAALLGVPLPLAAGAIVSGAFVGDRTSPFSSAHQLVASSTGLTVRQLGFALAPTTVGAALICIVFFLVQDGMGGWGTGGMTWLESGYSSGFRYGLLLAVPPVLLVGGILLRMRSRYAFLLSIASAVVIGSYMQQVPAGRWLDYLWNGYVSPAIPSLHSKGVLGMLDLMLLIALAGAFNGILEEQGLIRAYLNRIVGSSPGTGMGKATLRTALFGLALGLICCTQTLPIMMTGRSLLGSWTARYPAGDLARVTADTSLIFAAMVPWNMLAILCGAILGLPVESYVPYAAFLWSLPLLTAVLSWLRNGRKA